MAPMPYTADFTPETMTRADVDATLETVADLRQDFPFVGVSLAAT